MSMTDGIIFKEINEKVRSIKQRIGEFAEVIVGSVSTTLPSIIIS